jgi:hypothetical protein
MSNPDGFYATGQDTRDRVIRVETKLESMEADMADIKKTINEIHDAFMGAKGAKWAIMGSLPVLGALSTYLPDLFKYINKG